jgi:hypothetical protein
MGLQLDMRLPELQHDDMRSFEEHNCDCCCQQSVAEWVSPDLEVDKSYKLQFELSYSWAVPSPYN